ncbi:MAG: TonB-dependent receptor, partial [Bacteroidota bacterium]
IAKYTSLFYPSVSTSFVLSELWELPQAISFAKLRASWAQVGNDTDPFQTAGVFLAQTPFNSQPTFSDQNFIPNSNLKPEQTSSIELGADLRFFDDRLNFDFTYYDALTENQILSLPIAVSSGYEQQVRNGGAVRSKGVEILLNLIPVKTANFRWTSQFNFSRNVSTVESLPQEAGRLTLAYNRVYDNTNQTVWFQVSEGDRIGDIWGTGYLRNEQGEFVIGEDGRFIVDNTLKKLGNYNPDFILGFSNQFRLNNWQLNFVADWRQGGELVSRTQALAGVAGQLRETEFRPDAGIVAEGVVNTGSADNPVYQPNTNAIPAETYYRQFYDRNHEENNTYDATFVKLRELSLRYNFPRNALRGSFFGAFDQLSIAVVGRNLFAISEIPHFDPEQIAVQGQRILAGVEDMSYATTRSFGISLNLGF